MRFLARTLRPDRAFSASYKSIHPHLSLLTLLLLVRSVLSFTSPSSHPLFTVSHSSPRSFACFWKLSHKSASKLWRLVRWSVPFSVSHSPRRIKARKWRGAQGWPQRVGNISTGSDRHL